MKTSVLGSFGAAALLAITISACGGATAPQTGDASPGTSSAAESAAAPNTPAPTPTPEARAYTSDELTAIVRQLRDAADRRLTVMPSADLAATLEQSKEMIASIDVSPAECKELAASSTVPSLDGAAMAMGVSTDTATGAVTALSLLSGLDEAALGKVADPSAQLQQCSNMTMTASGVEVAVTITPLDGVGGVADTAYRTDTQLPDGRVQSIITAQAVHQGVVLTAVASGGESEADAVNRAGALLDSAAALVE